MSRHDDQSGFALVTAIIVMFAITVLTVAAVNVGVQSSGSTSRDTNVKAEIAAAEAGLQVATYRLGQLKPTEAQCIGESAVFTAVSKEEVESKCKDASEPLGNGASFQYWTSLPLKPGEKCAGHEVLASSAAQRCVTSEGKVNGVTPAVRLQTRLAAALGEPLFPVNGIVGLNEFVANGSVEIPAVVASNGKIIGEGGANFQGGFELCPEKPGTFTPAAGAARKKSGVKVHGETPGPTEGYEKVRKAGPPECPIKAALPATHATEASNEDSRIGVTDKFGGGGYTWNSAKYELTMESTASLTLGTGGGEKTYRYYFCSFKMPGGGPELKIAAGAKVEIFIDAPPPEDPTSKCAGGTGGFEIAGGSKTSNEGKKAANFLILMYGKGPFKFANGSGKTLEAAVFVPNGEVFMEGGVKFGGGIVGNIVHLENGTKYEWSTEVGNLGGSSSGVYKRESWEQCASGAAIGTGC